MIIQTFDNLLDIEHALVNFWDEEKLEAGKSKVRRDDGGEEKDEEEQADLSKCSRFLADPVCWHMLECCCA